MLEKFSELPEKAADAAALSLYEGAAIVADAVSNAVQGIATEPFKYRKNGTRLPSPEEKAIVAEARRGVSKFRKSPLRVDTSVGFQNSGYAQLAGRTVPIPVIANAINSGTSFMKKQPFYRRAVSQSRGAALAKIENKLREEVDKLGKD